MSRSSLQLGEARDLRRCAYRLQRIGWCAMAAILALAVAGFGGDGPVARATATGGGGALNVDYSRFARAGAVDRLRIRVAPTHLKPERVELFIDRDYLDNSRVQTVMPPPERVVVLADAIMYQFAAANAGLDLSVAFHVEPLHVGRQRVRIWLPESAGGTAALDLVQFVWP